MHNNKIIKNNNMFSQKFLHILYDLNEHITPSNLELNQDFIKLYDYLIILYSRNVFRYNGDWKKITRNYSVDYEYINHNNCAAKILDIQSRLRFFANIFKLNIKNKKKLIK